MYWGLRDRLGEARTWIDQLLPTADSLDPQVYAVRRSATPAMPSTTTTVAAPTVSPACSVFLIREPFFRSVEPGAARSNTALPRVGGADTTARRARVAGGAPANRHISLT
jgi:hypothetical protein